MGGFKTRGLLLSHLAQHLLTLSIDRVLRVGIDGVDGAGKTFFADELAELISVSGRPVIRSGVDGFHNPRSLRYRQGKNSARGFFEDSYNYESLRRLLLDPLSPGGSGKYVSACFDHVSDQAVNVPEQTAPANAILIFDGIFLHRPELSSYWDFSVFLDVPFDISIPRGAQRGSGSPDPEALSNLRYIQGQKLYLSICQPQASADLVLDNSHLEGLSIISDKSLKLPTSNL